MIVVQERSATDADLDIGLLLFSLMNFKYGYWKKYNQNGITYQSRALEIIKSIRLNMCSDERYLYRVITGQQWNKQSQSGYFATAWMKVFDNYQKEVDFSAVVEKCYAVYKNYLITTGRHRLGRYNRWTASLGKSTL